MLFLEKLTGWVGLAWHWFKHDRLPHSLIGLFAACALLFGLLALFRTQLPDLARFIVSMSIAAETDVLEFRLDPIRTYRWRLPPGEFLAEPGPGLNEKCVVVEEENPRCSRDMLLELRGSGTARVSLVHGARGASLLLEVWPHEHAADGVPLEARIRGSDGNVQLVAAEGVAYQSDPIRQRIRLPVIARQASIGAPVVEPSSQWDDGPDGMQAAWPQMVRSGNVQIFAASPGSEQRYPVSSEDLSMGDFVEIKMPRHTAPRDESEPPPTRLWGFLVVDPAGAAEAGGEAEAGSTDGFHVVLHTNAPRTGDRSYPLVRVSRFGATEPHVLGVDNWVVYTQMPWVQETGAFLAAIILIGGFLLQLHEVVRDREWRREERNIASVEKEHADSS